MAITNANLPVSNGSGDAALAHIQSNRIIGATTIATDTISNWPTNFIATTGTLLSSGFIDPTSKTDFYGHLGTGNQLIIDGFCPGNTDNGNTSGQVVVIKPNTEWANLIATGVQSTSQFPSLFANFVESNAAIWTQTSGLVGTQTAGYAWYQGIRYSIPAVATFTFTASKDTYIDVNPVTGAYTYVPVSNGAQEPAVTASSVRVAKVITGASAITSIYQNYYNSPVNKDVPASRWSVMGTMSGVSLTNAYQDIATVTLPATTKAHKYAIVADFTFNAGGITGAFDMYGAVRQGNTVIQSQLHSTVSGAANYFRPIGVTATYTASASGGDIIQFSVQANANSTGISSHTASHYIIFDLGEA